MVRTSPLTRLSLLFPSFLVPHFARLSSESQALRAKLLTLMKESFDDTRLLEEDGSAGEDHWLRQCHFDEQREALLEEYMRAPHCLTSAEVNSVVLDANSSMFPRAEKETAKALGYLKSIDTYFDFPERLYEDSEGGEDADRHGLIFNSCYDLLEMLQPTTPGISYVVADWMAAKDALGLLLKLLVRPIDDVEIKESERAKRNLWLSRLEMVISILVGFANASQRHTGLVIEHPVLIEAAVRVVTGQTLAVGPRSSGNADREFFKGVDLADPCVWQMTYQMAHPMVPPLEHLMLHFDWECLANVQWLCLQFVYHMIGNPATQVGSELYFLSLSVCLSV